MLPSASGSCWSSWHHGAPGWSLSKRASEIRWMRSAVWTFHLQQPVVIAFFEIVQAETLKCRFLQRPAGCPRKSWVGKAAARHQDDFAVGSTPVGLSPLVPLP